MPRRRLALLLAAPALAAAIAISVAVAQPGRTDAPSESGIGGPAATVEPFDHGPNHTIRVEIIDGERHTIYEPRRPDPATLPHPVTYGPFLLVHWGDPSGSARLAREIAVGTVRAAPEEDVLASGHVAEPSFMPGRELRREVNGLVDDAGLIEVRTWFFHKNTAGESRSFNIVRWRAERPFRVEIPSAGSTVSLSTGYVGNHPAVFTRAASPYIGDNDEAFIDIWWFEDDVLNQLQGSGTFADLLAVAESMVSS
jgi:hypothetical protein